MLNGWRSRPPFHTDTILYYLYIVYCLFFAEVMKMMKKKESIDDKLSTKASFFSFILKKMKPLSWFSSLCKPSYVSLLYCRFFLFFVILQILSVLFFSLHRKIPFSSKLLGSHTSLNMCSWFLFYALIPIR